MNLGQKIEQLLKMTSMTKVELSKKLGLKDSSVVSHWVKNRFKPDRDNIVKLSHVFEKPVSYFTDDNFSYTSCTADDDAYEKKIYDLLSAMPSARPVGVLNFIKYPNRACRRHALLGYLMKLRKNFLIFPIIPSRKNICPLCLKLKHNSLLPLKL